MGSYCCLLLLRTYHICSSCLDQVLQKNKLRTEPEVVPRYVTPEVHVVIIPSLLKAVNPATMSVRPTLRSYGLMSGKYSYPEELKHTQLKGRETWTIKASDARRITAAAEMKYMRRTAGYTWTDYKTNAQVAKELKITQILDKLLEYKRSWIQHVNRMHRNKLPRVMKYYCPTGRRNHGRPLKRLLGT